jgi:hypothetical protein
LNPNGRSAIETSDPLDADALFSLTVPVSPDFGPHYGALAVYDPAVFVAPDTILIDLDGSGVVGVEDPNQDRVPALRFLSISPNPMSRSATIRFEVPTSIAYVLVRVFDIQGRLIRALPSGNISPGIHEIVWDGENEGGQIVGSGMYFVRLELKGGAYVTRKVLVTR